MATLADSFLADLDDLSDTEAALEEEPVEDDGVTALDDDMEDVEALNYDDLDTVAKLQRSTRFLEIMKNVEDAIVKVPDESNRGLVSEDDPEYQLIVDCNTLSVDIDNEIVIIHNFIRDKYRLKFPELESLVLHPSIIPAW